MCSIKTFTNHAKLSNEIPEKKNGVMPHSRTICRDMLSAEGTEKKNNLKMELIL